MEATDEQSSAGEAVTSPPVPMLTVAAVARRLGVAPPTLRTWDRRYGLGPSAHTAGAHRRYSPADVARLMVMRRLTLQGVPPANAARIALATPVPEGGTITSITPLGDRANEPSVIADPLAVEGLEAGAPEGAAEAAFPGGVDLDPYLEAEDVADRFAESDLETARRSRGEDIGGDQVLDAPWRDEPDATVETPWLGMLQGGADERMPAGGGRVVALPDGTPRTRGLARAAMSLDTEQTARLLRSALRTDGVLPVWDRMVLPVLGALDARIRATGDGIDVQHALVEVVFGVLREVVSVLRYPRNPAPVLLAAGEHEQQTLPLHVVAAALAEREVGCRMFGAGMPWHALAAAVRRSGPCAVVLHAQLADADASAVEDLRRLRPAPRIVLGGPGWRVDTVPSGARLAAGLGEAVDEVLLAVPD